MAIYSINVLKEKYYEDENSYGFSIIIPRAYAREESDKRIFDIEDAKKVDHFELFIRRQVGTYRSRRNAYVFFKLPESGRSVSVVIYPDSTGVEFEKSLRKYVLRELDELDRRIILGFCRKHAKNIFNACYTDINKLYRYDEWLQKDGLEYRASMQPKRIRAGGIEVGSERGRKFYLFADGPFEPYDESVDNSIFANLVII